jgi:PAS domain-containing protein
VILDDASAQNTFSADEYILGNHVLSLLCLPLIRQTALVGVLYLENNLAPRVFTPSRAAVLKLIASQAAISLENVRLYDELRHSEAYLSEAQRISHTGSFGWRPSSGEIYWSEETFRIFEYDPASTPTLERLLVRIHPDDVAAFRQVVERASADGLDFAHEYRLRMPDERVKHIHVVAPALPNQAEIEFVGAVMDITAIRLAERELHKTRTDLAHVTRVSSLGELSAAGRRRYQRRGMPALARSPAAQSHGSARQPRENHPRRDSSWRGHSAHSYASEKDRYEDGAAQSQRGRERGARSRAA